MMNSIWKPLLLVPALLGCLCYAHPVAAQTTAPAGGVNLRQTITVQVVRQTKDAVVNISTTKLISRRVSPFGDDPFWQGLDLGDIVKVPANSLGSGFIVHPDGYVITNHHVIDRARQITVELVDGRKFSADLISSDAEADLAVLRIHSDKPLPSLQLGDSSDLMIGEPVIAIGNPLGYSHSVSTGIVSAIHRDLRDRRNHVLLGDLIQTDAAINPGNSGGPLLNAYGQVIGINTAIRSDAQNIGFAIQINRLRDLIPELMNPAQVTKVDVPFKLREKRQLTPPATVTAQIELVEKDKNLPIASLNGKTPRDLIDAYAILLQCQVGQELTIQLADGQTIHQKLAAIPQPDALVQAQKRLGISIEPLTPMLAEKYKLAAEDGMFITRVDRGSIADNAGLQAGDIIIQLGRYRVSTLEDFGALLQHLPDHGRIRIGIIRGQQVAFGYLQL